MPVKHNAARPSWPERAACNQPGVNPDWFFPEKGRHGKRALLVCGGCPVRDECLADALARSERDDWGIRGGLTERERQRLRRRGRAS